MAIAARAGEVLADLGVAVGHFDASHTARLAGDALESCSHSTGRRETVEVEQGSAVHDRVADLDDTAEPDQAFLVDLISAEQFGVVTEVAQKPVEFPQCSGRAVEAAGNRVSREFFGLEDREAEEIERFSRIPPMVRSLDANQEQTIANLRCSRLIGLVQALDSASHAAPSFAPR